MNRIFKFGIIFEISLVFIAILLSRFFREENILFSLKLTLPDLLFAFGLSLLACCLALLLTSKLVLRFAFFQDISIKAKSALSQFLPELNHVQIILLALAAGVGEEILFRGTLDSLIGIYFSALLFGLLHSLSYSYFIFATLLGLGLSALYAWNPNLLALIGFHFCFDAVVLFRYKRLLK